MLDRELTQEVDQLEKVVDCLVRNGMEEGEAKGIARQLIDSMGYVKISKGECPLGQTSPMACMYCEYGHMTECHHPNTCEEAECSHYQADVETEDSFIY
jgi:hypothetical protein